MKMTKGHKVLVVFLTLGIVAVLLGALYYDVQERKRYYGEYQKSLVSLNDSITTLRSDLIQYKEEIKKLDLERDSIRSEIKVIFKDNEKINSYIANGGWDYNLRFLTDFLSDEDSVGEGHHSGSDTTAVD